MIYTIHLLYQEGEAGRTCSIHDIWEMQTNFCSETWRQ